MPPPTERMFHWQGQNAAGQPQQGQLRASDARAARLQLLLQGIQPRRIGTRPQQPHGQPRRAALTRSMRQLGTLLHAGLPLLQALEMTAAGSPPAMAHGWQQVRQAVESGHALHQALRQQSWCDSANASLIEAGEASGTLDQTLLRLAAHLEQVQIMRSRLRAALAYPLLVLFTACIVLAAMLVFVVPTFAQMFAGFGAELPWPTRLVIRLSQAAIAWGWLLPLITLLTGLPLLRLWQRHATMRLVMDTRLLQLPLLGPLLTQAATARWARVLATLVRAGLPLADALPIAGQASGNRCLADRSQRLREQLLQGSALAAAMQQQAVFPPLALQLVQTGEASGTLEQMLARIAELCEAELQQWLRTLSTVAEPALMLLLGLLVGGLVLAMYLPIFQLGAVV